MMMVFLLISSGSLCNLSICSLVASFLFIISFNIISSQLLMDSCKKYSPIQFVERPIICNCDKDYTPIYAPRSLMTEEELKKDSKTER